MSVTAFNLRRRRLAQRAAEETTDVTPTADVAQEVTNTDEDGLTHVGAGWYELPNGKRVRGRKAALQALEALREV